jgi:hypothetical protein
MNFHNAMQYIPVTPPVSVATQESTENEPSKSDGKSKKNNNPPKPVPSKNTLSEKPNESKAVNHDAINVTSSFRNLTLNGNYIQIDDINWFNDCSSLVTVPASSSTSILSFDFVSYNVSAKIMPASIETDPISLLESGLESIPSFGKSDLMKLANERKNAKKKRLLSFSCSIGQQEEIAVHNLLLFVFHPENANSFKLLNRYYRNPKFSQNHKKQKEIKDFYEQSSSESEGDYEEDDDDEDNLMKGIEETVEEGTGTVTETNSETNSRVSSANISKANNSFSFGGGAATAAAGNIRTSQETKEENPFSIMKSIKRSIAERRMSADMSEMSSVNPMETEKEKRKKKRKFKKNKLEKDYETMIKHQYEDIVATVYDRYLAVYQSLLVRKVNLVLSEVTSGNTAPRSVTLSMVLHLLRSGEQT